MDGYFVEVWQSDGEQAEEHSTLQTFEGAMDWIMSRKFDDAGLKGGMQKGGAQQQAGQDHDSAHERGL